MSVLIETTKAAYELAKKGMTIEFQEKLMQLREQALELQEENLKIKKESKKLKEKIELQEKVKFKRKVYFHDGDEVPFCPYCFEKSNLLIHLSGPEILAGERVPLGIMYVCQECRIGYVTKDLKNTNGDFRVYKKKGTVTY